MIVYSTYKNHITYGKLKNNSIKDSEISIIGNGDKGKWNHLSL